MTYKEALNLQSNDYSEIERDFHISSNLQLLSTAHFPKSIDLGVSIIIPCYNGNNTIELTLQSIIEQSFKSNGGQIEIIIIDDASKNPILQSVHKFERNVTIRYIRLSSNVGAGRAREIGAKLAQQEVIIFIDSDIILPSEFLNNHVFAHSHIIAPAVLLSFRENVYSRDIIRLKENSPDPRNGDHRIYMKFKKEWVMTPSDELLVDREFKLLQDTDGFKSFGNGKKIKNWSLPLMVLTCSMSVKRSFGSPYFSVPDDLQRCYFDDTCIAAKMIAFGAKVIPLYNSDVYHYMETNHTRSDEEKNKDFLVNEIVYLNMLDSRI